MRKHVVCLLVTGVILLMPACARSQGIDNQPVGFTGGLSHAPGYAEGGWFLGFDFLFLKSIFPNSPTGSAPDSILSAGYKTQDGTVYQLSWWDQWLDDNPNPARKLQIIDFSVRVKTYDNDCYRSFAVFGPRLILTSEDYFFPLGLNYNVDNNMVGFFIGCMNEWRLGTVPIGDFSYILDTNVGVYADFVRQAAGSPFGANTLNTFTLTASFEFKTGFIWYVWEGITIHAGLEFLTIPNIQVAHQPVAIVNGAINTNLTGTWPMWIGFYLGFGFVF